MDNLKQAQLNYDNQTPPDNTELDEWTRSLAEELIEYGVIDFPNEPSLFIYLDELELWLDKSNHPKLINSKISKYKELQVELAQCMIADIIEREGE